MVNGVIVEKFGGTDVLQFREIELKKPKANEITISHKSIGINYIDIYYRKGLMGGQLPMCLGFEGCGYVTDSNGHANFKVGDRVAYITAPIGAYCQMRNIDPKYLIAVPSHIKDEDVAAILFKGVTAYFLLRRTMYIQPNMYILVNDAVSEVGAILCQMAKHYGAIVIGTVNNDDKSKIAKRNGCHHVINYISNDFTKEVLEITKGIGVSAVYDSVGKDTFEKSIDCVGYFGLMTSYGETSGEPEPFSVKKLATKSIFLTKPVLFHYETAKMELVLSANEVFDLFKKGVVKSNITNKFRLDQAAEAHNLIEQHGTTGTSIFLL